MAAPVDRPAAEPGALANLDARSREIFRRIVESYLTTGEPVGSRHLSRMLPISLSPASVRNVMQDLEELGLIYAPHASAGRLPTQQGLRFFVDALLEFGDLGREERARIDSQVRAAAEGGGFEGALAETTSLLSDLTRGAGVVLTTQVRSVASSTSNSCGSSRTGRWRSWSPRTARSRTASIATPDGLPASALTEASNYLNARVRGRTLSEATAEIETGAAQARGELDAIAARLVDAGLASWAGAVGGARPAHRARPGQSASATCAPPRISSASARCSPTSKPRPTSSTSCTAPRPATASRSSSARRTSYSRCPDRR